MIAVGSREDWAGRSRGARPTILPSGSRLGSWLAPQSSHVHHLFRPFSHALWRSFLHGLKSETIIRNGHTQVNHAKLSGADFRWVFFLSSVLFAQFQLSAPLVQSTNRVTKPWLGDTLSPNQFSTHSRIGICQQNLIIHPEHANVNSIFFPCIYNVEWLSR